MRKLHGMIKLHAFIVMTQNDICIHSLFGPILLGVCSMDTDHCETDRHEQDKHPGGHWIIFRQCDHRRSST